MKLKVVVDGTNHTKVINKDTGEEVKNITSLSYEQIAGETGILYLTVADVSFEGDNIEGELYEN